MNNNTTNQKDRPNGAVRKKRIEQRTLLVLSAVVLGAFIWVAYVFGFGWTGFLAVGAPGAQSYQPEKTLWDWLQLLIVPAVLALGALWLNIQQSTRQQRQSDQHHEADQALALDQQRETTLQKFLDDLSDLLLKEHLRESTTEDAEVRQVARAKTLAALNRLYGDGWRKGVLLRFLSEAHLIQRENPLIRLKDADLTGTDLRNATWSEANPEGANLSQADLTGVDLRNADLRGVNLSGADLTEAKLAELAEAIPPGVERDATTLNAALVSSEQLEHVWSLKAAIMPDGCKHP